jgi:hypothetical protein
MKDRPGKSAPLSRRRFVSMVAAGSAAILAAPAAAGAAASAARTVKRAAAGAPGAADRKEFVRQQVSTLETLRAIRKHAMPPGTEIAAVFRPLRAARAGR